jgi:DNA-binding XRE family transcriptional regulator
MHVASQLGSGGSSTTNGVHDQTIGYLERGEDSPSMVLALQLAEALGEPVTELFSLHPFPEEASP